MRLQHQIRPSLCCTCAAARTAQDTQIVTRWYSSLAAHTWQSFSRRCGQPCTLCGDCSNRGQVLPDMCMMRRLSCKRLSLEAPKDSGNSYMATGSQSWISLTHREGFCLELLRTYLSLILILQDSHVRVHQGPSAAQVRAEAADAPAEQSSLHMFALTKPCRMSKAPTQHSSRTPSHTCAVSSSGRK